MTKTYQTEDVTASAIEIAVPEAVIVSVVEIAGDLREGLLALAVGAGLQVLQTLMDADVAAVAGPRVRGRHGTDRVAVRHGTERGSVTLGGRRVPVTRPRVRAVDGSGVRRALLRRGTRDRHRRDETPARGGRRIDRERDPGDRAHGGFA